MLTRLCSCLLVQAGSRVHGVYDRRRTLWVYCLCLIAFSFSALASDASGNFPYGKYASEHKKRPTSEFASGLVDLISESDVERSLQRFLAGSDAGHRNRIAKLSATLRPTFIALPKDEEGRLPYQTARYALHRFMMQTRGWFVRGLESSDDALVHHKGVQSEWVPAYLQGLLAKRSGKLTASLEDLTVIVATMEDLIYMEVRKHFQAIYKYLDIDTTEPASKVLVACAVEAFVFYTLKFDLVQARASYDPFGLPGNFTPSMRRHALCDAPLLPKLSGFRPSLNMWSASIWQSTGDGEDGVMNFSTAEHVILEFADNHHKHNEEDCRTLKDFLLTLESKDASVRPGRVAFDTYHSKGRYSFWTFDENEAFLRSAGVLDPDAANASIVVANYIGSRINCIESSTLYAVCCKLECDSLLSQLELHLMEPFGTASRIAAFVATLPSTSVEAPRQLPLELRERLDELQATYGGHVPIHSEAFALWMSLAYPRECPLPHADSSSTHPMTAGEWIHVVGESWVDEGMTKASEALSNAGHDVRHTRSLGALLLILTMAWLFFRKQRHTRSSVVRHLLVCIAIATAVFALHGYIASGPCVLMCALFFIVRGFMRKIIMFNAFRKRTHSCCDADTLGKYI
eukprot:TRINITY_DN47913_c0_g1_i1.p1 TRINITY_DN47913_c0_g1~~TRINITY_DN47913_c0_g1_i1.p1  ORF type:complete len:630 (-),score=67.71 TRINITY_DN47913_c0_g1_i1:31-1920(-)